MNETTIQITVSGDNAAETVEKIAAQFPEQAQISTGGGETLSGTDALIQNGIRASADLPGLIGGWFARFAETSSLGFFGVLLIIAAIIAGAWAIDRAVVGFFAARQSKLTSEIPDGLARTAAGLRWGLFQALRLVLFFVIARTAISAVFPRGGEPVELALCVLGTVLLVRIWYAFMTMLAAPGAPQRRPTGLTDAEATLVLRRFWLLLVVIFVTMLLREFVMSVVDAGQSGALFAIATRLASGLAIILFFLSVRKPVGNLIRLGFATDPDAPNVLVRFFMSAWPLFYILLQLLQIGAEARGYLSGTLGEDASSVKRSFGAFVMAPFFIAAFRELGAFLESRASDTTAKALKGAFSFAEGFIIVGTGIFILYAWDIDPFATDLTGAKRILPGIVSAAIICVIGLSIWRTASAFLAVGEQSSDDEEGGVPEGEGGVGGSRIDTVLPVIKAVLAASIGMVTVLLALSALGVQIAPLLAGAGILGLAVGFGAQKVVEDVISGVLYLVEDAFRKGEYIETSQGKGVVEGIMLRSVRLRHHLGPVFTIPFSSMGTIQNHSRDWVTVKLKFEVAPDQDLEKVRKLVKKVGQELLDDPELEGQFLAPLKSQGAVALVGSNYQIGVKFTSEPGKQFLIRRKALNAIQKAFRENGIEMAAPRVVVDSMEHAPAAAAKAVQDAAQKAAGEAKPA